MDTLLLVHARWCDVSAARRELLAEVSRLWDGERRLRFAEIDVSLNDIPRSLGVRTVPSLLFFKVSAGSGAAPRAPVDLSAMDTRAKLSDAIVAHASASLSPPADAAALSEMLALLPRFSEQAQRLLDENAKLTAALAALRARAQPEDEE